MMMSWRLVTLWLRNILHVVRITFMKFLVAFSQTFVCLCVWCLLMLWLRQHCHLSCQWRFRIYLNYLLIDWFQYCSNSKQCMRKRHIKRYSNEKSHYVTWLTVWYCNHSFCFNWGTSWNGHYRAQFVLNPTYSFKIS